MAVKFYVGLQGYHYSGLYMVEIAMGGLDHSGADAISAGKALRELGCDQEYTDPREAVEVGIKVAREWKRIKRLAFGAKSKAHRPPAIHISIGANADMGLEFEPMTHAELRAKAEELWEKLPKCERCQGLIDDQPYGTELTASIGEYPYCSTHCADVAATEEIRDNAISFVQEEVGDMGPGEWYCALGEESHTVRFVRKTDKKDEVTAWEVDSKTFQIRKDETDHD